MELNGALSSLFVESPDLRRRINAYRQSIDLEPISVEGRMKPKLMMCVRCLTKATKPVPFI